ncbi:MAG: tRNA-dihydrouridine synthase family protein [Rhodospirillales bacterium]|nr:tRNA-dihydrouridine synthase family protein [Rhodospirillales bacterium]
MTVTLAPMEGVVDFYMREILTRIGGFDLCVTEFIRVSNTVFPASTFYKYCPELKQGGKTYSGVPVHVQFMGWDGNLMGENAAVVCELGAPGIDINFGCPAKTVNRRNAGAALLQWPERVHEVVKAVRQAVPDNTPVSAKMRLGFEDTSLALENAQAIESGGAGKLTVHARTKLEGYKPPAHWDWLARIKEAITIPLVANGDIWTLEDYKRCREVSGCEHIMVGRGAIAKPDLGRVIKNFEAQETLRFIAWPEMLDLLLDYYQLIKDTPLPAGVSGRLKQWIKLLSRTYPEAEEFFVTARLIQQPKDIAIAIEEARRKL